MKVNKNTEKGSTQENREVEQREKGQMPKIKEENGDARRRGFFFFFFF